MSGQDNNQRLEFIGLSTEVRTRLHDMQDMVGDSLDPALDRFYATVSRAPEVAHLFRDDDHRAHARGKQRDHWMTILSGRYDDTYFDTVGRIGKAHSNIGLEPRYYIAGYAALASDLIKAALRGSVGQRRFGTTDLTEAEDNIDALLRAIFFDMDLAISIYLEESESKARDSRREVADTFEQGVAEVIDRLARTSGSLDSASGMVSAAVDTTVCEAATAAAGAEEASANVKSVAAAAEQMQASAHEIAAQVSRTTETASAAVDQAGSAGATMAKLRAAADEIGSVVGLIQDIAEQTNLLALNATIESARAGEAGKGFAVVASEVKALAGQTAKATDQISSQIGEVQSATGSAASAIDSIRETIDSVNAASVAINAAVEEQSVVIQEIARNTAEAASGNEDSARAAAALETSVREAGEAAHQVNSASNEVREEMTELNSQVQRFLEQARAG